MKTRRNLASMCLALSCGALFAAANVSVGDQPGVIRMTSGQETLQPPAVPPAGGDTAPVPDAGVTAPQDGGGDAGTVILDAPPATQQAPQFTPPVDFQQMVQRSAGVTESPVLGRQPFDNPTFGPLVQFETNTDDGLGFNQSFHTANVRVPYHIVPGNTVLMADLSASVTNNGQGVYNFGAIYRNYDAMRNRIFGWNGYFDMDDGRGNEQWQRVGFGFETLGKYVDFRANGYWVAGDESVLLQDQLVGDLALAGNSVFRIRNQIRDNAYGGADFEVGGPLPVLGRRGLNLYGGGYYLDSEYGNETFGFQARFEALVTESLTVNVNLTNDDTFGTNSWVSIAYTIPSYRERSILQPRRVRDRLQDPVIRSRRVHSNLDRIDLPEAIVNTAKGRAYNIVYVDPNATSVTNGGDGAGTIEDPFTSLQIANMNNNAGIDVIRIVPRSDDTGTNLTVPGGITLHDCQALISSTKDFTLFTDQGMDFIIPGAATATNLGPLVQDPNMLAGGSVIRIANENQILGLRIDASNAAGTVFGTGISNPLPFTDTSIVMNTFTNYDTAIDLQNGSGDIVIDMNTMSGLAGASQSGLLLTTAAGTTTNLLVRDNTATNNSVAGLSITSGANSTINADNPSGFAGAGNPTVQPTGIVNNTVTNSGEGIVVSAQAGSTANVLADGNTSTNNTFNGFVARSDASAFNLSLSNNTFSNNIENGAFLHYLNGGTFQAVSEDLNGDGVLDPGEDLNGNGLLDQGIVSNTMSDNTIAGLCIFGEDNGTGGFDIGGPDAGLGNTFAGNLGAGIAVDLQDDAVAQIDALFNSIRGGVSQPGLTVVLDFIEPSQGTLTDGNGIDVNAFDVTLYGFNQADFGTVTSAIRDTIQGHYRNLPTIADDPRSVIPAGEQLAIDFVIGDAGVAPSNGATEYYVLTLGDSVQNLGGLAGLAGDIGNIRNAQGQGPGLGLTGAPLALGGSAASVYTNQINQFAPLLNPPTAITIPDFPDPIIVEDPSLTPAFAVNALTSGDLTSTRRAIGLVASHELGHSLSLRHIQQTGADTPNNLNAIMGTPAIDSPLQSLLEPAEFAFSGTNPGELLGEAPFLQESINQLAGAIGTRVAGNESRNGFSITTADNSRLIDTTINNNQITGTSQNGINVSASGNSRVENMTIQSNTITSGLGNGIRLHADGNAFMDVSQTIGGSGTNTYRGNVFAQGNTISGNTGDGFVALASNGGTILGNLINNTITDNTGNGASLLIDGGGTLDFGTPASNRIISGNTITGNGGIGLNLISTVTATGTGLIDAVVQNNTISDNTGGGISSQMFGPNMGGLTNNQINLTVGGLTTQANTVTGNGSFGLNYSVAGNGKGVLDVSNSSFSGNNGDGIRLTRADSSLLTATIENVVMNDNTGNGLSVDVQGNDPTDPNQPMSGTANTIVWNNNTLSNNTLNGASFRVRGNATLLADGIDNLLNSNGLSGILIETSQGSQFGDATMGLPPGRRVLLDGVTATENGLDGITMIAGQNSRILAEITSNRRPGSTNAHSGLNTNGDTSISDNARDGIRLTATGGQSDVVITSGTGNTVIDGNGTGPDGGNGVRFDASGNTDTNLRVSSVAITNSIAGASEEPALFNNGVLDPGEDINGNLVLDQGEDTNNNENIDTANGDGIQLNFFDNTTSTVQVGGIGSGNRIQGNADDGVAITATGTGNLLSASGPGESVPRPVISLQENEIGGEFNGVAAGNTGDGLSINAMGDVADNSIFLSDPANVDTDLTGGLFGNTDGVQQSGAILQVTADNNKISRNGGIGLNLRLNGAGGERDRENGNSNFDPIRLSFTNNEISSNGLEGIFLRADSDMNQGRFTYLPNFPFPNPPFNPADQRPQVPFFYDPNQVEFDAQNAGSVNGNTAFLPTAPDGAPGFLNLRTVQNSFLILTGNTIQNNGVGTVTGEGIVLEVGTGAYVAADIRNNEFGGNLEEDVRTASFLSAGNTFSSVDVTGDTTLDVVYHDDSAQLDMRFTNNSGNEIAISSAGATYTDADALKGIVLGLGVTSRAAGLFQVDDGGNLDNPNNRFINFGATQDIDGTFATGGFNLRGAADPMFPNIGFAPFLP